MDENVTLRVVGEPGSEPRDDELPVPWVAAVAGVSYRQLNHWIVSGYVAVVDDEPRPGSGSRVGIPPTEVGHVVVMARLVLGGVRPAVAASLAAELVKNDTVTLAPGITLSLTEEDRPNGT